MIERLNKTLGGQTMTNKKTFKFQISTLVVIALIAMLSVACKNKATAPANFSAEAVTEEVIEPDGNQGIEQFEGKVYKSYGHAYKLNPNHVFSFSTEVYNFAFLSGNSLIG